MPTIKGLSHVVLYVKDLDKMVAFYRDVLGLIKYREHTGRMVFLTADPNTEDHELALTKGAKAARRSSPILPGAWTHRTTSKRITNVSKP